MRSSLLLILAVLLCSALAVTGCTSGTNSPVQTTRTADVTLSSLTLDRSDIPGDYYILTVNKEKNISEMGDLATSLGWKRGYVVEYTTVKDVPENFQNTIRQTLATYPESSMPEIVGYIVRADQSYDNLAFTEFPAPGLGPNGRVFVGNLRFPADAAPTPAVTGVLPDAVALKENTGGRNDGQIFAEAIFTKGTTLEVIRMTGPAPDPANLTAIAQRAYQKIP